MPSIELSGVALRRSQQRVLEHVTVAVGPGEIVVIKGGRGAGKSSLLAVAAGALRPETGAVLAGGRSIIALQSGSLPYLRRYIGYLPAQPPFLEEESALENLMLALAVQGIPPARARELARTALVELGLDPTSQRPLAALSSGERRLAGLGRALSGPPPVLVLDDPTLGLDDEDRGRALHALLRVQGLGSAVLCASSDATLVAALGAQGARVLELHAGRIVGGPPGFHLVDGGLAADETTENTDVVRYRSVAGGREAG